MAAGQEIEGDLWDQFLGLDLLPPTVLPVHTGFGTISPISVQNWGSRNPFSTKSAPDEELCSCMVTVAR
jgi:hypothetical protein